MIVRDVVQNYNENTRLRDWDGGKQSRMGGVSQTQKNKNNITTHRSHATVRRPPTEAEQMKFQGLKSPRLPTNP